MPAGADPISCWSGLPLPGAALVGTQYFESDLTPIGAGYVAMLIGVPILTAIAVRVSPRRVQIWSPASRLSAVTAGGTAARLRELIAAGQLPRGWACAKAKAARSPV